MFQLVQEGLPDALNNGLETVASAQAFIQKYIPTPSPCPQLAKFDFSPLNQFPGRIYSPDGPATNYSLKG
jgi:hypothetical protein